MKKKTLTKALSMIVVITLLLGILPVNAWAADHVHDASCGYAPASECTHSHDDTCGYAETVAGATCNHTHGDCSYVAASDGMPCNHVCDFDDCGYYPAIPGTPCDKGCSEIVDGEIQHDNCDYSEGEPEMPCTHTHDASCGYVAPTSGTDCDHSHNANCGYVESVEAKPCTHAHDAACGYSVGSDCTYVEPVVETTTYTITYTDGVESEEIFADVVYYVAENETVPTYVPPDREGFIFDGWNPNYTATVTADTIFTAKWREHISDGYTVTYTDGVDSEEIFLDMVYEDLSSGDATPAFEGTPTREGFTFAGWNPEVAATVTGDATYTAQWTENAPAHTHDYTAVVTEPTCIAQGYTTYTCSCNDSYVSDYVDALGHDWGDYESDGNGYHTRTCTTDSSHYQTEKCGGGTATCTEPATCSDCGATYGSLNSTNHSSGTELRDVKDATETEDGYTGDTYCLGCGYKLSEGNTIPATGNGDDDDDDHTHNYSYYKYDGTNHWKMCICGQGQAGSVKPHSLVLEGNNNGHWKECTICNYYSDAQVHVYSNDSDEICNDCGYNRHVHSFPTATCITPAVCSCGSTYGGKNPNNHAGGTEIRNAAEATIVAEGYTGDTYCLGCGSMIASGEVIPKAGVIFDGPGVEDVTFIPAAGTELPGDADIIVNPHTPSADNLAYVLGIDADTEYLDADNVKIQIVGGEDYTAPDGTEYRMHEIIIINGEEYLITNYMGVGDVLVLMRLSDGATGNYNVAVNKLDFTGSMNGTVQEYAYDKINISGITYDVRLSYNSDAGRVVVLYYNGSPAGKMYINESRSSYFREGFDPETLKVQQNENDLGTVTPGENPIDGLVSGKTYNVSVIGSNDIHLEGVENVSGTVTQTFDIPVQFVNNPNVKYVAVHVTNPYAEALEEAFNTWRSMREKLYVATRQYENGEISLEELNKAKQSEMESKGEYRELVVIYDTWEKEHAADNKTGNELGTVTISEDGKTLTATYTVDSFSPFIVYAFVEADEPEIKTLSATIGIIDESTPQAPAAEDAPGSPIFLWITLMSLTAIALLTVVIVVRKRSHR